MSRRIFVTVGPLQLYTEMSSVHCCENKCSALPRSNIFNRKKSVLTVSATTTSAACN